MSDFSGIGLVALDRELGCLEPNIASDSIPMKMIENVNIMFEALATTEMNFQWWKYFPTKAFSDLKKSHNAFLEYVKQNLLQYLVDSYNDTRNRIFPVLRSMVIILQIKYLILK